MDEYLFYQQHKKTLQVGSSIVAAAIEKNKILSTPKRQALGKSMFQNAGL